LQSEIIRKVMEKKKQKYGESPETIGLRKNLLLAQFFFWKEFRLNF
jgi:hypothetical protein